MPTPDESGQPHERPVLEPIRVLRPRNTDALAELFREMAELTQDADATDATDAYEAISLPPGPAAGEAETEELPPLAPSTATTATPRGGRDWASEPGGPRSAPGRASGSDPVKATPKATPKAKATDRDRGAARGRSGSGVPAATGRARAHDRSDSGAALRRGAITVGVCAAALVGFACALLLPGRGGEAVAQTPPPSAAPAPTATDTASADPDGAGTLREGDSGSEVTELQKRLLRIPNVYDNGPTDGRYGTVLTEAVARFQLWYGIRGDESGVYGDDTRRDLESRTTTDS